MYNILVVDDERIHREGLIMLLEKICPDDMLWEASNGQEAMEIMNNISCEIVISDIRMAEMDGLQLQKKVKTDYPETAFVIVSGYADFSYAREALQFHAAVIRMTVEICEKIRSKTGENTVALSGGVFANRILLRGCIGYLRKKGFMIYWNESVPSNDGGISLGQAFLAGMRK